MKQTDRAGGRLWLGTLIGALLVVGCGQPQSEQESAAAAANSPAEPSRPAAANPAAQAATAASDAAEVADVTTDEDMTDAGDSGDGDEVITELKIIDVVTGDGPTAEPGQTVVVHYTGWLYDPGAPGNKGEKFDSSVDRGQPFAFPLGARRVIQGWDQGFGGMQVGGKRTLIIPPEMGYGARGAPPAIPPDATLLFDVELLGVQ